MGPDPVPPPAADSSPEEVEAAWQEVGFHRPLAGILYNLIFIFIAAGFGVILTVWLIPNYILPFPEALGFTTVTTSVFGFWFTLLDLGIGSSIQRFVAEENVSSPRTAIRYIQFFSWYQMFSGLGQVTFIAWWVFAVVPRTELAYAMWFFLIYSTVQYPGMLGIFRGTLEAFQRYHKASLISFIQTQIFENVMRIIFILLGRWLGAQNPAVGEIVGATAGALIGTYLRDFITAWLGAHWVAPVLRAIDPSYKIRNMFHVEFDRETVKKCLSFGLRAMVPGLISPVASMISTFMIVAWMPGYASVLGMYAMGEMLAHMVTTFAFNGVGASVAESYFHKKTRLMQYYYESIYKWLGTFAFFMIGLLFFGAVLINVIVGENYSLVLPIIQHFIFFKLAYLFLTHMDHFFNGVGKPEYGIYLISIEQGVRLFLLWLLLVPIPSSWIALVYSTGIAWIVKFVLGYIMFNKKILAVKINLWQTLGAPGIAAVVQAIYIWVGLNFWYPPLAVPLGKIPAAIIMIIFGIISSLFVYFPALALAGGWDDGSLRVFQAAAKMSGPSKFVIKILYKMSAGVAKISPLTNKFPIDDTGVKEDCAAIMQVRAQNLANRKDV